MIPCTLTINSTAQKRRTICCSVRSVKQAPSGDFDRIESISVRPRASGDPESPASSCGSGCPLSRARTEYGATSSQNALALQGHALLRVLVGRELLVACRVAVVAQDVGDEVGIGLRAERAWPVGRHGQADIAIKHGDVSAAPARAEIAALERWPAELAIVERRAMAILAALPIGRLSALGLRCRECRCCRPLLRGHRNGTAQKRDSECKSEKPAKQHVHDNTWKSVIVCAKG